MRWFPSLAILTILAYGARAEEPHLEFVDKLRAAGLADLAGDYIDILATKNLPDIAGRLPLERAKTLVALAEQQDDDKKRDEKLSQARGAFEDYLKTTSDTRAIADIRFELARLLVRQGKYRVIAARRLESKSEKQDALARARVLFEKAAGELKAAEATLTKELATANGQAKSALDRRVNEAKFELGVLTLNKGLTHTDASVESLKLRNQDVLAARKLFLNLAELDSDDPLCWRAYVEAGRCWTELDNTTEAKKVFSTVAKQNTPSAREASRIARFYELQLIDKDTNSRNTSSEVIRGCEEWLTKYRSYARTPEGQGIQFLLATNLIQQAQRGIHAQKNGPAIVDSSARQSLIRAEKYLKDLAATESDYSRKAGLLRSEVLVLLTAERAAAGIARLNNFEECFLTAQVEVYQSSKVPSGGDAEAKRQRHLRRAIQALQRGLALVSRGDDPKEVFTARVMLSYVFLISGDPYSAAILGEHLALSNLNSQRGVKAAVYALSAYATILGESKNRGASPDEIASDVRRLRRLADLVLTNEKWKDEPETDAARFQIGSLYFDGGNYRDAYRMFADIKESFPAFALARYRQGAAAQLAQAKDSPLTPDEKKRILQDAILALEKVADPTAGSSTETVLATYQAKLQLGQLLMLAGEDMANYERVEKIGVRLKEKLKDLVDKNEPAYGQLETEADRARVAGLTGKAYLLIKQGKYDDARRQLDPLMTDIAKSAGSWKKSPNVAEPWFQAYVQTLRDVVVLDARANILEGKPDAVKLDLDNMRSLTADDKQQETYDLLLRLVFDLKRDLDGFKKVNDADRQRKVENGLVGFLDELTKPKDLSPDVRVFLAQGYAAIDRHDKAAELLEAVPAAKPEDESGTKTYRYARLALARERRLNREFDKAKTVLREIMGTSAHRGWGYDNFEVRKEAIAVLEDEGNFPAAVRMALDEENKLLKPAQEFAAKSEKVRKLRDEAKAKPAEAPKLTEQADLIESDVQKLGGLRERFFEFYYCEIHAILRSAQKNNDAKSKDTIGRLAIRIAKLEHGQPDLGGDATRARFKELVEEDPTLKEKYIAAGGKLFAGDKKQ